MSTDWQSASRQTDMNECSCNKLSCKQIRSNQACIQQASAHDARSRIASLLGHGRTSDRRVNARHMAGMTER
eukprot:2097172-Alexandrium_andersonii.AAC.1